jgi:hypothetical protein
MALSRNEQLHFLGKMVGAVAVAQAQQEGIEQTVGAVAVAQSQQEGIE